MSTRVITLALVVLLFIGAAPAAARTLQTEAARLPSVTSDPLTLAVNLGSEPLTLDPALATDSTALTVIEQLFVGLVKQDDATAEIRPELAMAWTISPDGKTYTFTLRGDAVWSDGNPITAHDVRYGILRTLDPATQAAFASLLFPIKNAEAFNSGAVTDPAQVGVVATDNTHLQILLEHPAATMLSILALWVARPMPAWAITAHGSAWTEPANIVTSGAYRLTEWAHNDHILLDKNATYYDAGNVQIDQVKMWMVDDDTAWIMYLNGELDTTRAPSGAILDPVLSQEVYVAPRACTYYYGFSLAQPPFDQPLVRKAFIAATDRRGLVDTVLGGFQQPALTFASPGVFGHVDGAAEGVGIPYDPTQARQWLAQAGYPNGQGLPPITVWFNTGAGHQAIAEYVRDSWSAVLGVDVTVQDMAWSEYLNQYKTGSFQVWRMGWCSDYLDSYNFLRDAIDNAGGGYGGWNNATYEGLLDQAIATADPDARKSLYKQAEEILVESDAVMLPLYFYATPYATKPHLERTFPASEVPDISAWRIVRVQGTASPESGGVVTSYHGDTTISVPAGTFTDPVTITQAPAYGMPPAGNLTDIGHVFEATAVYTGSGLPAQPAPDKTYTVTVHYTDQEKGMANEGTLRLYGWDGSAWSQQGISSTVDTAANLVTAQVGHFSLFAVFGETHRLYLPLMLRK